MDPDVQPPHLHLADFGWEVALGVPKNNDIEDFEMFLLPEKKIVYLMVESVISKILDDGLKWDGLMRKIRNIWVVKAVNSNPFPLWNC